MDWTMEQLSGRLEMKDRHILVVVQLFGFDGCRFAGGTYPFFSVSPSLARI